MSFYQLAQVFLLCRCSHRETLFSIRTSTLASRTFPSIPPPRLLPQHKIPFSIYSKFPLRNELKQKTKFRVDYFLSFVFRWMDSLVFVIFVWCDGFRNQRPAIPQPMSNVCLIIQIVDHPRHGRNEPKLVFMHVIVWFRRWWSMCSRR